MAEGRDDLISIRVGERLHDLPPASSECSIFKVPVKIRKQNEEAYEPQILAIGPYHRGKDHLMAMEEHKIRYLQMLLQRRNENDVTRYVVALRALEERARKCYAELSLCPNSDDFVEMMLLDGCFIVELIRKYTIKELRDNNDPIFIARGTRFSLRHDMLLLENQLPFFVIWELFGMTVMPNQPEMFTQMICKFFEGILPGSRFRPVDVYHVERIKHLLGFIHESWLHSHMAVGSKSNENVTSKSKWGKIPCARELQEAGVEFRNVKRDSLFDIRFENGIMKIPPINIYGNTEYFLRNLVAYELCAQEKIPIYVCDYIALMNCLIKSVKDVELLARCKIISNSLSEEKEVVKMFSRLYYVVYTDDFNYADLFTKLNKHCSRNTWKAISRHNYFNSPWALISFVAAGILLLLTILQAIYTVLSYYHK